MNDRLRRARAALDHARPLERAAFACKFAHAPTHDFVTTLLAFRTPDGGYGHALEPDLDDPHPHPLFVDFALKAAKQAGVRDLRLTDGVCAFLERVATPTHELPYLLPSALDHPRAQHWQTLSPPSLELTYGVVGLLYWFGVAHPWLSAATATCWTALATDPPRDAHALIGVLDFLAHAPPHPAREACWEGVCDTIPRATWLKRDPSSDDYGLSPLELVPTPTSPARACFADELLFAHLDALAAQQQPDGAWPISWEPPSEAAHAAWRGKWTLNALVVLDAWGVLDTSSSNRHDPHPSAHSRPRSMRSSRNDEE